MVEEIRYCEGCGIVGWKGMKCNCTIEELQLEENKED
jgi:hypothetical protein